MTARDNGLRASRYAPLADLEPGDADAVLAALREEGVAAYAAPGQATGRNRDDQVPERRGDRVWVDADEVERARGLLRSRLPDLRADSESVDAATDSRVDEEAAWEAIVAGYGVTVPESPGPESPDPESTGPESMGPESTGPDQAEPSASEDHYVPPPPPPLPATDTVTKLGWAGVVGGPAYLLLTTIIGRGLSERAAIIAVTAFVVGFVTLVARMKDRPPTDSGPDDGAVV